MTEYDDTPTGSKGILQPQKFQESTPPSPLSIAERFPDERQPMEIVFPRLIKIINGICVKLQLDQSELIRLAESHEQQVRRLEEQEEKRRIQEAAKAREENLKTFIKEFGDHFMILSERGTPLPDPTICPNCSGKVNIAKRFKEGTRFLEFMPTTRRTKEELLRHMQIQTENRLFGVFCNNKYRGPRATGTTIIEDKWCPHLFDVRVLITAK